MGAERTGRPGCREGTWALCLKQSPHQGEVWGETSSSNSRSTWREEVGRGSPLPSCTEKTPHASSWSQLYWGSQQSRGRVSLPSLVLPVQLGACLWLWEAGGLFMASQCLGPKGDQCCQHLVLASLGSEHPVKSLGASPLQPCLPLHPSSLAPWLTTHPPTRFHP